ncbi:5914_t:CDS:2 [Gigaspora margarita]|uniref:5914_t:CDS:1 n=1 Tax=Gigaspora margarita TaxID=4874 RepID=A0ABN7VCH2_GIGMA|nr:5914_t:CDS:2 [Gigaspora margarita]
MHLWRKKDNAGKAVEVPDPLEEEMHRPRKMKSQKKGTKTITSKTVVTEAANYAVIVENDWMRKAQARLDWEACELIIRDEDRKIRIPTEYYKPANIEEKTSNKNVDKSSESEEEEEIGSDDKSEKYEKKNLLAQPYLYYEFQLVEKLLERKCEQCLKKGHEEEDCVLQKEPEDWTICLLEETKDESRTFNLEEITEVQKE